MNTIIELFGWYGMTAIMVAYALVSFALLPADSLLYQLLNATGSVGIICVSLRKKVYQSVILNVIWTAIATLAIGRMFIR